MSTPDPSQETKPLIVLELWQLVLLGLVVLVGFIKVVGGGTQMLLILFLLAVLGGLLVMRSRKQRV